MDWSALTAFNTARISSQLEDLEREAIRESDRRFDAFVTESIERLCQLQVRYDLEYFMIFLGNNKLELPNKPVESAKIAKDALFCTILSILIASATEEDFKEVYQRTVALYTIMHADDLTCRLDDTSKICDRLAALGSRYNLIVHLTEIRDSNPDKYPLSSSTLDEIFSSMGPFPAFRSERALEGFIHLASLLHPCFSPGRVEERIESLCQFKDIFGENFKRYSSADKNKTNALVKKLAHCKFDIDKENEIDRIFFPEDYETGIIIRSITSALEKGDLKGNLSDYIQNSRRSPLPGKVSVFKAGKRFAVIDLVQD